MKKTNEEILEFLGTANRWLQTNQDETKFRYAVAKIVKKAERARGRVQEEIDDFNVEHAMEDRDTKKLLKNDRGEFEYTKDGLTARNKAVRGLMQKETDIEPHFADAPEGLKSEFVIAFEGFVIKEGANGSNDVQTPS